jgi:HSP20 family protein
MQLLILHRSPLPIGPFEEERTGLELTWRPDMDVFELPAEFLLRVALPGVRPDDVAATVAGKTLVISGERRLAFPEGAIAHLIELTGGRFERRVRLPDSADASGIRMEMADGQLLVRVPKAEPRLTSRIQVQRRGE